MGCRSVLTEEFRKKKFGFGGVQPERFHMWVWPVPPSLILLYRLAVALYVDFWFVTLSIHAADNNPFMSTVSWASFLTFWTYAVLGLYLTSHFLATFYHYVFKKRSSTHFFHRPHSARHESLFSETRDVEVEGYEAILDSEDAVEVVRGGLTPWYLALVWILFNVVSTSAIMVTLVFFVFLFPHLDMKAGSNDNVQMHILNSVLVVLEHVTTGIPHRLLHVVYPLSYGVVYFLFSLFYWLPDHDHVMYPGVLDWNNPGQTVGMIFLIGFVVMPAIHLIFFGVYRLKMWIHKCSSCC